MKQAAILRERLRRDIQARTDKVLRELGYPEPPLRLEDVRELLHLDRDYFSSSRDGLLHSVASKLKRGGIQLLLRGVAALQTALTLALLVGAAPARYTIPPKANI